MIAIAAAVRGVGRWLTPLIALASVAACGPAGGPAPSTLGDRIPVVATTTVFADLVRNVGGDLVQVTSLVPAGADVHTFAPRPADVRSIAAARLLVMNGLGLDDWLAGTIRNAAAGTTPLVQLGVDLPGVALLPGEEPGTQNPHLWLAVPNAERYAERIRDALIAVDRAHEASYRATTSGYLDRLRGLDAEIRATIGGIPAASRRIVTFHDALPYYAREYGLEIVGVAVQAPGQDPSAAEIAALISAIRASGVRAIFSENQFPTALVDSLAKETGASVVATLYSDSVGAPPVTSYEAVMRWDTDVIAGALR